jgi:hypothetical protein
MSTIETRHRVSPPPIAPLYVKHRGAIEEGKEGLTACFIIPFVTSINNLVLKTISRSPVVAMNATAKTRAHAAPEPKPLNLFGRQKLASF